jgi:hypothetical protein
MQRPNKIAAMFLTLVLALPAVGATKRTLKGTYITTGLSSTILINAGSFASMDTAQTVNCPAVAPATCSIEADQFVRLQGNAITGNVVVLCFYVDGAASSGCPFIGNAPSDGSIAVMSDSQLRTKIAAGSHTVQTLVGLNNANTAGFLQVYNFTSNYKVFTP